MEHFLNCRLDILFIHYLFVCLAEARLIGSNVMEGNVAAKISLRSGNTKHNDKNWKDWFFTFPFIFLNFDMLAVDQRPKLVNLVVEVLSTP